ncbi:MAG: ATP synthase F1 subunit gamma [Ignavibacteriaceae bacterium]|nr:ATP synthase F1 subunit gamma [Ignavibacteriaceae bacterium]
MATLSDIKTRIKGVQNTQQITKAMKMVAAAKLRRAQEAVTNSRPYARQISILLSHLVSDESKAVNPFFLGREVKNIAVVVVTADKGLCGAFNTNLIKEVTQYVAAVELGVNTHLISVGRKGYDFFRKRDYNIAGNYSGIFQSLKYEQALGITQELIDKFLDGTFDKVVLVYNEFKSIIQQRVVTEQFLPIPISDEGEKDTTKLPDFIFEPDQKAIFEYLLPKHLKAQMWRSLLESNASEQGARMTAMDNATTNAKELIRSLNLTYNKERQAAITKEILEIVSGANALRGN